MSNVHEREDRLENATLLRRWTGSGGGTIHPSMGIEHHYDEDEEKFEPRKNYHDLEEKINEYQKAQASKVDVRKCNWAEVKAQLKDAQTRYDAKNANSKVRKVFADYSAPAATMVMPLLDIIPDEMGLTVLRAGLSIIFGAVKQRGTNREKIFKAFEDIPDIIEKADTACHTFSGDTKLREATTKLYNDLLEEVPKLIEYLLHEESILRRIKNNLKCPEAKRIEDAIQSIEGSAENLASKMEDAWARTDVSTFNNTEQLKQTTANTAKGVQGIQHGVENVQLQTSQIHGMLMSQREKNQQEMDEINKALEKLSEMSAMIQTQLLDMSLVRQASPSPVPAIVYNTMQAVYLSPYYKSPPVPPAAELLTDLLKIVDVPEESAKNDLRFIGKQATLFNFETMAQARSLMQHDSFKIWFSRHTGALLVNGNFSDSNAMKMSPISVFCATLAVTLIGMKTSIILHFFCGEHAADHDSLKGPRGLVRSMISQLILYPSTFVPEADFMRVLEVYQACDNHDIAALCYAFEMLVLSYPAQSTIICVVDNISAYERDDNGWSVKLEIFLEMVYRLTAPRDFGPGFKVLLTSPTKSGFASVGPLVESSIWLNCGNISSHPATRKSVEWGLASSNSHP